MESKVFSKAARVKLKKALFLSLSAAFGESGK
jgi:hypothetical protein